jgi:hypothetical protein
MLTEMQVKSNPHTLLGMNWCKLNGNQYGVSLKKLKIDLSYDSTIPFLDIYLKECKSVYGKATCIHMSIAALFTIANLWNQSRGSSTY